MKLPIFQHTHLILVLIILAGLSIYPLHAQNYTEVNVYGWGLALDQGFPTFGDIDNDGYIDLLVGSGSGTIWHLEQTTGDDFALITRDFNNIDVGTEAMPVLINLDNDGLLDLLIGSNSEIDWYEQQGVGSSVFILVEGNILPTRPGAHLCPAIADINNDGLLDMLVGESLGTLVHFVQDSANGGTFTEVDDYWMEWDGGTYIHPSFTDLENDGKLDLLVGRLNGLIYHLVQDELYGDTFTQVSDSFAYVEVGEAARPRVYDTDSDDKLDLYVADWYGGLFHYEQIEPGSPDYVLIDDEVLGVRDFGAKAGYTIEDIDGDSLLDMLVAEFAGESESYVVHYEQDEQGSLLFNRIDESFNDIEIGHYVRLSIHDINGNGLMDLFVSDVFGETMRYEQDGIDSYTFTLQDEQFNAPMRVNQNAQLAFADFDGDQLLDMLVGEGTGLTYHYEQDSINANTFSEITDSFLDLDVGYISSPVFTDVDGDDLLDLIFGNHGGDLRYYEQETPNSENFVLITDDFGSASVNNDATPRFADVNLDGRTDLFIGDYSGGIKLYLRGEDDDIYPPDIPKNLSANVVGEVVDLYWTPSSAADLMLYNIFRSTRHDTTVAEYIFSISGERSSYSDSTITESGTYYYWLTALDSTGNESGFSQSDSIDITISAIENLAGKTVEEFSLKQNYPNPFNPITIINYELPITDFVELSIYNLLGEKVAILVSAKQNAGYHQIEWNASRYASGVYYYRLQTNTGFVQSRKLVLLK